MSKRNVAPAKRGTAQVRPPPARRARTTGQAQPAPQPAAEPVTPKPSVDFSPKAYVKALERLRLDVQHGELSFGTEELNQVMRCRGYDILAGELVASALRKEEIGPHQLMLVLGDIIEAHAKRCDNPDERGKAMVLLTIARWVRMDSSAEVGFGVTMMSDLVGAEWGGESSSLINIACALLDYFPYVMPDAVSRGEGYSVGLLEHRTREFIRAVFDHAGLDAAQQAVAKIDSGLWHFSGQRSERWQSGNEVAP